VSCAKTAEPIRMLFWIKDSGGSKGPCIRLRSRSPNAKVQFLGEMTCPGIPDNTLL